VLSESVRVGGLEFEVLTTQQFRPAVQASSTSQQCREEGLTCGAGRGGGTGQLGPRPTGGKMEDVAEPPWMFRSAGRGSRRAGITCARKQ